MQAQPIDLAREQRRMYLDSNGDASRWQMININKVNASAEQISKPGFNTKDWMPAIVPGTVLNSLVADKVYPEPYYGINNKMGKNLIPDISKTGRDFYSYWFRTEFNVPDSYKGKVVWMELEGINYRAEVWLNGIMVGNMSGMFRPAVLNVTDFVTVGKANALAVRVVPVDIPGTMMPKSWGAPGEWHNGGDGNIGLNTTMLMSVGWDFTFMDGIRDRNTGIWKSISLYTTDNVRLQHPFVKSKLNSTYDRSEETVSVEVVNAQDRAMKCTVEGSITGTGITFCKDLELFRAETREVSFTPEDYRQLIISNPRLWWPLNKGPQNLYELKLVAKVGGKVSDTLSTRFGIREIRSDQNTPDKSRQFYVNGKKIFVRGSNWIPDAMLRTTDARTYAQLRYTRQASINLLRFWGGGIAESDYFYQLCDEMGIMIWQEFWLTGDTRHPSDGALYLSNMEATVKRIRNHPSLAFYVSSNEDSEMAGAKELIMRLDGTRGYQMESECDGIHDGSPYKQVNPMQHYENTASERGSRIDGFNPEYGAPTMPIVESLRKMMPEKDLWPVNKEVWDYLDGDGFYLMTTRYTDLTNQYGESKSIDEFAKKGQLVGAMNSKSIWESWNENKLQYGDRYTSGVLFWYHNNPHPQTCSRMWDYYLEPTASLYHTANALEPLHPQFDYLKNTVSVVNDYYKAFKNYTVKAEVYDLNSRKLWSKEKKIDLPEDGVVNDIFKIDFPEGISQVHFIHLQLLNEQGKEVGSNFYWRSNDIYQGRTTNTGPAASGFADLQNMPVVSVKSKVKWVNQNGKHYATVTIKNPGNKIAFFIQLQLLKGDKSPVAPTYFSDNFFTLLPHQQKVVKVEVADEYLGSKSIFRVKGWNVKTSERVL